MNTRHSFHPHALAPLIALMLGSCAWFHGEKFDPLASEDKKPDAGFTSTPNAPKVDPAWLEPPKKEFALGPGDKLDIEILGEPNTRDQTFVTPDSKVYFNLLPGIDVKGKTVAQLQAEMTEKLSEFYKRPQVSVTLIDVASARVWVLGRLYAPGVYPLKRPMRVLDAISLAGGLYASRFTGTTEELADLEHSYLVRNGRMMPVNFQKLIREGDLSQNIYLEANDYIYLPSALTNEVYILGAVNNPRPVGFMNEMNVMAAIGRAEGFLPGAQTGHVTIVRGTLQDPKIAVVNVNQIIHGKSPNLRLKPGDIVYVPPRGAVSTGNYVNLALDTFARVIGANEGAHAVSGAGQNANISIGLGNGTSLGTTPAPAPAKTTAPAAANAVPNTGGAN